MANFLKALPQWNDPGIEPPQEVKDAGWKIAQRPPASYFDWLQHTTYQALDELQKNATHKTDYLAHVADVDKRVEVLTDYYIDLKNPKKGLQGVVATGDQAPTIQGIINAIPAGKTATLFLSDITINVLTDLDLPANFNLIGRNATIVLKGALNLRGNSIVEGLKIDGALASKSIFVYGENNTIRGNIIKNFKSAAVDGTQCIFVNASSSGNVIEKNIFDTIHPHSENGTIGDAVGYARAILSYGDCIIRENIFKNLVGYEDGDYIAISGDTLIDPDYPFNLADARGYLDVSIYDNEFYQTCKSSIKIMASGVKCHDNLIHVYEPDINKNPYAAIRTHRTIGVEIKNNRINVDVQKLIQMIVVDYSRDCIIDGNNINIPHDAPDTSNRTIIFINYSQSPKIYRNIITKKDGNCRSFRIENCKDVEIGFNSTTAKITNVYDTSYIWFISNERMHIFNNNVIDGNNGDIWVDGCADVTFSNNEFVNTKFIFKNSSKINIAKNKMDKINNVATFYWFNIDNITEINVINNILKGDYSSLFRIVTPSTAIEVLANNIIGDMSGSVLNLYNNPNQLMSEINYKIGALPLKTFDYGTTAERPTLNKFVGFNYFDTTLGKTIVWDGSKWIDEVGQLSSLTTTAKSNVVAAINELDAEHGALSGLTTTAKNTLVAAINEVNGEADTNATNIGTLANLTTTAKTNLVAALNEVDGIASEALLELGDISTLSTTVKTSAVAAINEVKGVADGAVEDAAAAASAASAAQSTADGAASAAAAAQGDADTNATSIGDLSTLTTTAKGSTVAAINELDAAIEANTSAIGDVAGDVEAINTTLAGIAKGTATASGDGQLTSVTIAHGLAAIPTFYQAQAGSAAAGEAEINYITADDTNLTVVFKNVPTAGLDNIVLVWRAEK